MPPQTTPPPSDQHAVHSVRRRPPRRAPPSRGRRPRVAAPRQGLPTDLSVVASWHFCDEVLMSIFEVSSGIISGTNGLTAYSHIVPSESSEVTALPGGCAHTTAHSESVSSTSVYGHKEKVKQKV